MEDQFIAEDFDSEQIYQKMITVTPVLGGWTVNYNDKNPNYVAYTGKDSQVYDPKVHTQYMARTRIFTDATKLIEWLNTRIQKD